MLCLAALLMCLLCQSSAESVGVKYRCNDSSILPGDMHSSFTPSVDGVLGRYTAELCTFNNPNRTRLTMDLTYNDNTRVCDEEFRRQHRRWAIRPGPQHSSNTVDVAGLASCSHVCYAMDFDLIFSSCYLLKITLNGEYKSYSPHDEYYLINNNATKELFNNTAPYINFVNHDDSFTLDWFLGIPAVDYTVTLRKINNNTGAYLDAGADVTHNCSARGPRALRCELAPAHACYQATLEHGGLWTAGLFHHKKFVTYDHLCHKALEPPQAPAVRRGAALWWACGAAALGAAALLAAAALRRRRHHSDLYKRAISSWLHARSSEVEAEPPKVRDGRDVLLLYAREGELGQRAMAALRDLLQHATGGTVYDMFSPEVMALCGPAPHAWVRGLLQSGDVRVVLVQSPAMSALYQQPLCDDEGGLRLREPLLGPRATYRCPHFGDQLLHMALRQLAETPAMHSAYRKYYLATYAGLETDILPQVEPFRRYALPGAAALLAAELGAGPGAEPGAGPGAEPGAGPGAEPGAGPGAEPGAGPGAEPGAGPGAEPGAGPGAEPGAGPGAEPGAGPGAEPGAGPGAEPGRLAAFTRAAHALLAHAQRNPDYLMDEIFIH